MSNIINDLVLGTFSIVGENQVGALLGNNDFFYLLSLYSSPIHVTEFWLGCDDMLKLNYKFCIITNKIFHIMHWEFFHKKYVSVP